MTSPTEDDSRLMWVFVGRVAWQLRLWFPRSWPAVGVLLLWGLVMAVPVLFEVLMVEVYRSGCALQCTGPDRRRPGRRVVGRGSRPGAVRGSPVVPSAASRMLAPGLFVAMVPILVTPWSKVDIAVCGVSPARATPRCPLRCDAAASS